MQKGSHAVVTAVFVKARGIVCGEAVGKGAVRDQRDCSLLGDEVKGLHEVFQGAGAFIVGAVDHSYLMTLPHLWLTMPSSAVQPLAPPVYPTGYLRRVGHVDGPTVRGCDDLAARSAFVISFPPPGKTFSRRLQRETKVRSCV
ncbi:hypothetical protein BHM03_00039837 [Ensete ventricosum]|nr:hypothetical protein BHM03_00039837 [Ensete ventricosum]